MLPVEMRVLTIACIAAWLGVMVFFSFAVAPLAFRTIDREAAGTIVAAVLPRYYAFGIGLTAVALAALVARGRRGGTGRWREFTGAGLCGAMIVALAWALVVTLPEAEAARRTGQPLVFAAAHRSAVRLNLLTMLAGAIVLVLEGLRSRDGADA